MKFNTPLSFICSKCPTFLMVLPALEMSPMQPSFLHPALCTPSQKKLIYKTRPFFIHLAVFAVSFSPLSSCKLEMKIMHICTLIQCTSQQELLAFSMCWHLGNILEASGKLSLRFRHSLYIEDVPLLERLNNCTIKCFFSCCLIPINKSKNREPR